jgi:manganese transport protein
MSLIASGVSSSVVGTMAGQMIMQGFIRLQIPLLIRRIVTMLPAFIVVAMGVNVTTALLASQVVLSIALPIPMVALVIFSSRRSVMGAFTIGPVLQDLAILASCVVLTLNFVLLADVACLPIPFLSN